MYKRLIYCSMVVLALFPGCKIGDAEAPVETQWAPAQSQRNAIRRQGVDEDALSSRGIRMLQRELGYLASLGGNDSGKVEVAARQVARTREWLYFRNQRLPASVKTLMGVIDIALAAKPAEAPEMPKKPSLEDMEPSDTPVDIKGHLVAPYEGRKGPGIIMDTPRGPIVLLFGKYPDGANAGDGVSTCAIPVDYTEQVMVQKKWTDARFYHRAEYEECDAADLMRKANRKQFLDAYKDAVKKYEEEYKAYRKAISEHTQRVNNFDQLRNEALASLPTKAKQTLSTLPKGANGV